MSTRGAMIPYISKQLVASNRQHFYGTHPWNIIELRQVPQFLTETFNALSVALLSDIFKILPLSFELEFHRTSLCVCHIIVAIVCSVMVHFVLLAPMCILFFLCLHRSSILRRSRLFLGFLLLFIPFQTKLSSDECRRHGATSFRFCCVRTTTENGVSLQLQLQLQSQLYLIESNKAEHLYVSKPYLEHLMFGHT